MATQDYKFYATMAHGEPLVTVHQDEDAAENWAKNRALESGAYHYVLEAAKVFRRPAPVVEMAKLYPAPVAAKVGRE